MMNIVILWLKIYFTLNSHELASIHKFATVNPQNTPISTLVHKFAVANS